MHRQIRYLILINSFFVFAMNMFAPLYAVYVQKIGGTTAHIGAIWGFYILCVGAFTYLISKYEDHSKYIGHFITLGFIFRATGWFWYIFASSIWQLFLIQVLLALGEGFGTPAYNSLFSRYLDRGKFASEWGLNTSVNSVIMGLASFAGGIVVYYSGFVSLFILMVGLSLISTLMAFRYKKALGCI